MSDSNYDTPSSGDPRNDDREFNPQLEPASSKAWLNLIEESEDAFETWNTHCDLIDKQYASLDRLSDMVRDKEFQMFWANAEVIKPSVYASCPVPVITTKFKDRAPVPTEASEMLERCCIVAFDLTRVDEVMILMRDDLVMSARGVAWCRYESAKEGYYDSERVCVDFKNRRDFVHSISRNWREVTWVAGASYLTRSEARDRFKKYSGEAYNDADYKVDRESKEIGGADNRERAKFWEVWDKSTRRVVWVSPGAEDILDEDDPHLELQNFFPCPRPAYGTVQRGSLIPVPDALQYKDQLEEVNLLTGRIHALSDALEVKGFYPAGGAELAEAIQSAIQTKTAGRMMVPISNWAAFGGTKEVVVWLPIDQIATTITALVMLRKQVIDDIYQITGMADIMRGDTDPNETLGAQQLKNQYGTTRIRDKQNELRRIAKDLVQITSEIACQKFSDVTFVEMTQTKLPTKQMQQKAIDGIQKDLQTKQKLLQLVPKLPQAQQKPDQIQQFTQQTQQLIQQGEQAIKKITEAPTLDQVLKFMKDNRTKSFVLDIETDSTIMTDEQAEKSARTEFMQVLGALLPQLGQMIQSDPKTADFCGEILKFATAPFRAGRSLDSSIDDLADMMKQKGDQPQPDDPTTAAGKVQLQIEQMKLTYAKQKDDADRQVKQQELQVKSQQGSQTAQIDAQAKQQEVQGRQQENQAKIYQINLEAQNQQREHEADMEQAAVKAQTDVAKHQMAMEAAQMKMQHSAQDADDKRAAMQFKMNQPPKPGGAG